jgi:hypothetical protein
MKILLLCMLAILLMLKMGCKKERIIMILPKKKKQLFLNFSHFRVAIDLIMEQQKIFNLFWKKTHKDKEMYLIKDK